MGDSFRRGRLWPVICAGLLLPGAASAIDFSIPYGEDGIKATLNTAITAGAQMRMQKPAEGLIGKANIDPYVCGRQGEGNNPVLTGQGSPRYQSCQGLFRTQTFPAARLSQVPGAFSNNFDDGDLNYKKGDLTQAPLKLTQDLTLTYKDYGFFARGLFFHDFVNDNFTENHPNRITNDNYLNVGSPANTTNSNGVGRNDSRPCGDRNPNPGTPCGIVYGAGAQVYSKRTDAETLRQIGQNFQLLDAVAYGKLPIGDKELTLKLGRQTINWGESTLLVINSINQAQPVNANNFLRTGFAVEEVFTPQASLFASMQPIEGVTVEGFYDFQWEPVEIPAPGSFFSFADLGTNNAGKFATVSFGGAAEDPDAKGRLLDNALSGLTDTSLNIERLKDYTPKKFGFTNQYGISLKYYADWLNNGTELGFYFMNYHSKLPYVSVYASIDACGRNSRNSTQFLQDCSSIPLLASQNDPDSVRRNADGTMKTVNDYSDVPFDSAKLQLEYPENIKMLGVSFNTTVGQFSIQGEVAYRPKLPLQVDVEDLLFAAYGPTLTLCQNPDISARAPGRTGPCSGTGTFTGNVTGQLPPQLQALLTGLPTNGPVGGVGLTDQGTNTVYPSSDFVVDANGTKGAYNDTFDLIVGHDTGSSRAFPSFIIPYRGGKIGENPGSDITKPYDHNNPGYIRGYEKLGVFQFNFGATQVLGATDNFLGADQVINLLEVGATWIPTLPPLDVLQFEAPGTYTHASAGADGSGANYTDAASKLQACSTGPTCSYGPDGLRFNPHQADLSLFPDKLSYGYRIISLIRYESVFPGISFQPMIIWQHDLEGTSPQPLDINFVQGRKQATLNIETRYKSAFSVVPGYTWFFGGGEGNHYRDRDFLQIYAKYQF